MNLQSTEYRYIHKLTHTIIVSSIPELSYNTIRVVILNKQSTQSSFQKSRKFQVSPILQKPSETTIDNTMRAEETKKKIQLTHSSCPSDRALSECGRSTDPRGLN